MIGWDAAAMLPDDAADALLIGRMALPAGPTPVLVRQGRVHDLSGIAPTVSQLLAAAVPFDRLDGPEIGAIDGIDPAALLSPIDLQVVKASGVTFATSALERVIEERARGDAAQAAAVRDKIEGRIGGDLRGVKPGSDEAAQLKAVLIDEGLWSQYLEVAIGPDAEIFTKSPVLSTVGWGADVGVRSDSSWNNPEPEIVLIVDPEGKSVGAALGNDVNLRDLEERSALLLGKAKDNNASCALGPFIRLFDGRFTMDDVRAAEVSLVIEGQDGYRLNGASSMREISRDPEELVRQARSEHHYPDGFALFLGTLFAPVQDRDEPGRGFTHKVGDVVTIASPKLGALRNPVVTCPQAPPWRMGIGELMANLAGRGLLARTTA